MSFRNQNDLIISGQSLEFRDKTDLRIGLQTGQVVVISPEAGQTDFTVGSAYQWAQLENYQYYKVETASSDTFIPLIEDKIVKATQLFSTLVANTGYWIRVTAMQIAGQAQQNEVTGVSITPSTATVTEGQELTLSGQVQGVGTFNQSGTWTRTLGTTPFTTNGNDITISPADGSAGAQSTFVFTSDGDNSFTASRQITVMEATAFDTTVDSREGDEAALQAIYDATGGDNWWNNTSWISGSISLVDPMYGITVATIGGELRVVDVDLFQNNLVGELPLEVGNLKKCKEFKVKQPLTLTEWQNDANYQANTSGFPTDSKLRGEIPWTFGIMSELEWLSLQGQYEDIDLGNAPWNEKNHGPGHPGVGKRYVNGNTFGGNLDPRIFNAPKLKMIEARRLKTNGPIPTTISQAPLVGVFLNGLSYNTEFGFTGNVPSELNDIPTLKHLHIGWNKLTGDHPTLSNLVNLRHYRCEYNEITGSCPIIGSNDMRVIRLGRNLMSEGEFPLHYFNGKNPILNNFDISWNNFSFGFPPDSEYVGPNHPAFQSGEELVDGHHSMTIFSVNQILNFSDPDRSLGGMTGPVPDWVQRMKDHTQVKLSYGALEDTFPVTIAELDSGRLRLFEIENNRNNGSLGFNGDLPDVTWNSRNLLHVYMWGNSLSGIIPDSWVSLKSSTRSTLRIDFTDNLLTGRIPSWFREVTNAKVIKFEKNQFNSYEIASDGHGFLAIPKFEDAQGNPATYADFQAGNAVHVEGFLSGILWNFSENELPQTDIDNIVTDVYDLVQWWRTNGISSSPTIDISSNASASSSVSTEISYLQSEINLIL